MSHKLKSRQKVDTHHGWGTRGGKRWAKVVMRWGIEEGALERKRVKGLQLWAMSNKPKQAWKGETIDIARRVGEAKGGEVEGAAGKGGGLSNVKGMT